jgi:hypothetical protein
VIKPAGAFVSWQLREDPMPQTIEIPRREWFHVLERFNTTYEGSLVSLDVRSPEFGVLPEVIKQPLLGITFESNHHSVVFVSAGPSPAYHVTHAIQTPTHIRIQRSGATDKAVEVVSSDGTTTIVRLERAVPSQTFRLVAHGG